MIKLFENGSEAFKKSREQEMISNLTGYIWELVNENEERYEEILKHCGFTDAEIKSTY